MSGPGFAAPCAPARARIVTFSSDFGTRDSYAAEMKGAFLSELAALAPGDDERLVIMDAGHDLERYSVGAACERVRALRRSYPAGAVHVVVVDPGVGTNRRALAVRCAGQWFLGPDNGVFTPVLDEADLVVEIDPSIRRPGSSRVFDGRDLFAPAAARLVAAGREGTIEGRTVGDPVRIDSAPPVVGDRSASGRVVHVDGYGNCRTDIPRGLVPREARWTAPTGETVGFRETYEGIPGEEAALIASSDGSVEIAMRRDSAAERYGLAPGLPVTLSW